MLSYSSNIRLVFNYSHLLASTRDKKQKIIYRILKVELLKNKNMLIAKNNSMTFCYHVFLSFSNKFFIILLLYIDTLIIEFIKT